MTLAGICITLVIGFILYNWYIIMKQFKELQDILESILNETGIDINDTVDSK